MAIHAHITSAPIARNRFRITSLATDGSLPTIFAHPITAADRAAIERDLSLLIVLLDALDAPHGGVAA